MWEENRKRGRGMGLKKCPFCGGKAEVHVFGYGALTKYSVCCLKCEAESKHYKSGVSAIEAWNRRVEVKE